MTMVCSNPILSYTPDPVGEAFRRQLSQSSSPSFNDDRSGHAGSGGRKLIDSLSDDEIIEYQRTGRLPSRTETLIRNFLHKSAQGQGLLKKMEEESSLAELVEDGESEAVSLHASDRYEIVQRDGQKINIANEEEFNSTEHQYKTIRKATRRRQASERPTKANNKTFMTNNIEETKGQWHEPDHN